MSAPAEALDDPRHLRSEWHHVPSLFVLVVVQPLLDLLAPNLPFFFHHRADPFDLAVLLVALVVVVPAILVGVELLVLRLLGEPARRIVHGAVLAVLAALLGLQIARHASITATLPAVMIAVAVAALLVYLYRYRATRLFLSYLAFGIPIVVVSFLASRDILGFLVERVVDAYPVVEVGSTTPVVVVVFDEFPLLSLVDERYEIDAGHFPNFARLASTSTWYRNATTVHSRTQEALSAILTGTMPVTDVAPTLSNYPRNLFTLLHRSHALRVYEHHTQFLPSDFLPESTWRERRRRWIRMAADLGVVFQHIVFPAAEADQLQSLSWRWGFFVPMIDDAEAIDDPRRLEADFPTTDPYERRLAFERFLSGIRASDRPTLDFFHSNLPHIPFCYLPSGRVYGGKPFLRGTFQEAWNDNVDFVNQIYQRHLIQVQYVDGLIGELMETMQRQGLWDESAVVITADHGASHWPGLSRRAPQNDRAQVDEILRVPLFVKRPHQRTGELSDRNMQSIDILPTLLDAMGVEAGWAFDGRPAGDPVEAVRKILFNRFGTSAALPGEFQPSAEGLRRKLELFDPAAGPYSFYRLGRWGDLVGRPLAEVPPAGSLPFEVTIDQIDFLEDYDPSSSFAPAELTGRIHLDDDARDGGEDSRIHLAFVLHGRIEAVTTAELSAEGEGYFSALVPEWALRPGRNVPRVFVVRGSAADGVAGAAQLFGPSEPSAREGVYAKRST